MRDQHGKGPIWLRGPSITRALCVSLSGIALVFLAASLDSAFGGNLSGTLGMAGWIVGAVGIIDFDISLFTILSNRKRNAETIPPSESIQSREVPGEGFRVGSRMFQTKEEADEFIYHTNVQHELVSVNHRLKAKE